MPNPRDTGRPVRWSLQDAKNRLSALVDAAAKGEPQVVTRRGIETAVVLSYEEYERMRGRQERPRPTLAEYLLTVPAGCEDEEDFGRIELPPRPMDLP